MIPILDTVVLQFDGGCKPTNPGNKYGSFCFRRDARIPNEVVLSKCRFDLGYGTNNEAEFEALETALKAGLDDLEAGGIDPKNIFLEIFTDSTIVVNRVTGKNQSTAGLRAFKMQTLAEQCLDFLSRFGGFRISWQGREKNVATFGH